MTKKNRKQKIEKQIILLETIIILGIIIYLFIGTTPIQVSPLNGAVIIEPNFIFEIEKGEQVVLSIHEDFSEQIILDENSEITLTPGKYYWKAKNNLKESETRIFEIQSNAGMKIVEGDIHNEVENTGNVELEVSTESTGIILGVNEIKTIEKGKSYEGKQNE